MAFFCERSAMISGGLPKTMASAFGVHEGACNQTYRSRWEVLP
jgi:hypothetical protein